MQLAEVMHKGKIGQINCFFLLFLHDTGNFGHLKVLIKLPNLLVSINRFKNFTNYRFKKTIVLAKVHFTSYLTFDSCPKLPQNRVIILILFSSTAVHSRQAFFRLWWLHWRIWKYWNADKKGCFPKCGEKIFFLILHYALKCGITIAIDCHFFNTDKRENLNW